MDDQNECGGGVVVGQKAILAGTEKMPFLIFPHDLWSQETIP